MELIAVFLILMVLIYLILGSRNKSHYEHDGQSEDPYYYYPNNPAPRYGSGYAPQYPPYYPTHHQQPYYPHYPPPYPQPYQQPYPPPAMQPEPSGNSMAIGIILFCMVAFGAFALAAKLNLISGSITIGPEKQERVWESREAIPQPVNQRIEGGAQKYSKDPPRR